MSWQATETSSANWRSLVMSPGCYVRRVERRLTGSGTVDLQASVPEVQLGLSRAGVTGVQKAVRMQHGGARRARLRRDRLLRRPRPGAEGRAHVALPGALRGGDRRARDRRDAARRAPRRAHRAAHRRAPGRAARRGEDRGALPDRAHDAGHRPAHAGARDADRARGRVADRGAPARRRRGDRDQRLPVRAGARPRPGGGAARRRGLRRGRRRADPRARPARHAQPARPRDAVPRHRRCVSTRRTSSSSSRAR